MVGSGDVTQAVMTAAEWTWPVIISMIAGAGGLVLGVWNAVDRVRDRRRSTKAALPRIELQQYGPGASGWCQYRVLASSPSFARFNVVSVRAKGWIFTKSAPQDPSRPVFDPGPQMPDLGATTTDMKLDGSVEVAPGDGLVHSNIFFWAKPHADAAEWKCDAVILTCRWQWGQRPFFRLQSSI